MIALCVDDEYLLLEELKRAAAAVPEITETAAFDDALDALEWAGSHPVDIAFLDVRLPVMDGIQLAKELRKIAPKLAVIFCTGYGEYAVTAFSIHADGYLLKPIRNEAVVAEVEYLKKNGRLRSSLADGKLLSVQRYGGFNALDRRGRPLNFRRGLEKELLAFLIHHLRENVSTEMICAGLWKDNEWMLEKNKQYLYTLLSTLRTTLREAGAEEIIQKGPNGYTIDPSRIVLDQPGEGDYLPEYEWAHDSDGTYNSRNSMSN